MSIPVALTIAGSDSCGGAGIQADLKTFAAHDVYGASALTLVTAQNTQGVDALVLLEPNFVVAQIEAVLSDLPVRAIKTGALGSAAIIHAVADCLRRHTLPLVVDPVLVSKGGDPLLPPEAMAVLREELLPLATLATPNTFEAALLLNLDPADVRGGEALEALAREYARANHQTPMLFKSGRLGEGPIRDWLVAGTACEVLEATRLETHATHGAGCTLSAAITARLARGEELREAVRGAHNYLQAAMRAAPGLGGGHGPLGHFPPGA